MKHCFYDCPRSFQRQLNGGPTGQANKYAVAI